MRHGLRTVLAVLLLMVAPAFTFASGGHEGGDAAAPAKEEKIIGYLLGEAPAGLPDVLQALNGKLKKDLNVTMEINYIGWGNFQATYPLVLAAGEDIDWIFTANWSFYFQEAAKGAFLALSDSMIRENMPLHSRTLSAAAWNQARLPDGKIYMIPTPTPDRKVPVAVIRGDLRRKYGVPPVTRLGDIGPYLKAIKDHERSMIPMNLESTYDVGQPFSYLSYANGPYYEDILFTTGSGTGLVWLLGDTTNRLHYIMESPILQWQKQAAATMKAWYDAGYINRDVFANKVRSKDSFVRGKSAVGFGNSIDMQSIIAGATANGWDVELLTGLDGNSHYRADPYLNNGVALAANTKNAARTLQALDRIIEDKSYNFLVYFGIEGRNYVVKNNMIALPDGVTADKNTYPPDAAGFWFTNKDQFPPFATWTPAYLQHRKDIVSKGFLVPTPFVAFSANTDEVKTEVANVNQTMVQYLQPLWIGISDDIDASFARLDRKLRAAGVDRLRQAFQAQVDQYMKRL